MKRIEFRGLAILLGLIAGAPVARAQDSSVELSVGGLVFAQTPDVSVESEEVRITPDVITVRYRLVNQGAQPATVTVAFPLPEIDRSDPDVNYAIPGNDSTNFVDFQTKVDGQPVKFDIRQQALLADKDVTATVRAAGLSLLPVGTTQATMARLSPAAREKLVAEGVVVANGTNQEGQALYNGTWLVKTSATRQQVVPPGKPMIIEHRYRASVGISFDTMLRKSVRESQGMAAEFKRYKDEYCIPDGFLRGIDRIAAGEANTMQLQERRISYALKSAANSDAPIKDFRLIIDKGRADRLVSFCADNVKKISATSFEMRARDFTPQRDIKILLITKVGGTVPTVSQPDAPLIRPQRRDERTE
jgi:hypothetical protein